MPIVTPAPTIALMRPAQDSKGDNKKPKIFRIHPPTTSTVLKYCAKLPQAIETIVQEGLGQLETHLHDLSST